MSGLDEFISTSLTEVIKRNLDSDTEKKIKLALFKKYGLSIKQAIKDFSKLDEILKEFLKSNTLNFEQKCLTDLITLKIRSNSVLVTIKDRNLINLIIEILGDKEYRKIIEFSLVRPLLISEIIDGCKLPKTSGYRKVSYLIRAGFLNPVKTEFTLKRRSIERFSSIFQKISIEMKKNQSIVRIEVPIEILKQSSSIGIIVSKKNFLNEFSKK